MALEQCLFHVFSFHAKLKHFSQSPLVQLSLIPESKHPDILGKQEVKTER